MRRLIEPLHDADVADLVQQLGNDERRQFVKAIRMDLHPEILSEVDEEVREDIIEQLGPARTAAAIANLETDDAIDILGNWTRRTAGRSSTPSRPPNAP